MKPNGCHNRAPFVDTVVVQTGWTWLVAGRNWPIQREAVLEVIPNVMSKDCQYSKNTDDPRCDGCSWDQRSRNVEP